MPELLESPPAETHQKLPDVLKPFTWTREEARQAAQRSAILRTQRAAQNKLTLNAEPTDLSAQLAVNAQLRIVAEQVSRTRSLLNDDDFRYCEHCERGGVEPHHRAQLLKALDTLLDRQRKLLGIGDPAPRKAERNRRVSAGWIELQPALPASAGQPQPAAPTTPEVACLDCLAPAKTMGWEYDDPTPAVIEPLNR